MAAGRGGRARVPARWGLGGGRGEDGGMERREERGAWPGPGGQFYWRRRSILKNFVNLFSFLVTADRGEVRFEMWHCSIDPKTFYIYTSSI
jgi:hypothetical protein